VEGGRTVEALKGRKRDEERVLLFGFSRSRPRERASERTRDVYARCSEREARSSRAFVRRFARIFAAA